MPPVRPEFLGIKRTAGGEALYSDLSRKLTFGCRMVAAGVGTAFDLSPFFKGSLGVFSAGAEFWSFWGLF